MPTDGFARALASRAYQSTTMLSDSRAAATARSVSPSCDFIQTCGYAVAGDGGGAMYRRTPSEPAHAGKLQSSDGSWWEIAESVITPQMFGAKGDGVSFDTSAFASAISFVSGKGGGVVEIPSGNYIVNWVAPRSNVTIRAHGAKILSPTGRIISMASDVHDTATVGAGFALDTAINYKVGQMQITLANSADGANFTPGMFVNIRCRALVSFALAITPVAELNRVRSVAGGVITLEHPLAKDYTYDPAYPYTVTPVDPYIVENFHIDGGTWSAPKQRPIDIMNCWNVSIRNATLTGLGGVVLRGRHMKITDNTIFIAPDWTTGFRPYYFGSDTGSADGIYTNNQCRSRGVGIVHVHEGCGNMLIQGNTFEQAVSDPTGEQWGVLSVLSLSWDVKILDNTIVNSPTRSAVYSNPSSLYANEGNVRLQIAGNTVLGTCATYAIQHSQGSLDTGVIIARNTVAATCNVAGNYQFGITSSPGVTLSGNVSSTGINLIDQATITAEATRIAGNVGFPDNIKTFIGTHDFNLFSGTPARISWRGARGTIWALDAAAQEAVDAVMLCPYGAKQAYVYLWWANLGTGTGDVRWSLQISTGISDGETANQADAGLNFTATAGTQDVAVRSFAGVTSLDDLTFAPLRVVRAAADAADTLGNDAGLIGVELVFR